MSSPESAAAPSPDAEGSPASPERPTGNKYDQMFGSDNESAQNRDEYGEDDEDEEAGVRKRPRKAGAHGDGAADLDAEGEADDDNDKGLFGDDSDDDVQKTKELSDHELEGTPEMDEADHEPERSYRSIDVSLPRHPVPNPGNDDLYLIRIPSLIAIQPQIFYPENFTLGNMVTPDSMTSPYTAATTTIRVRKSPVDPSVLQSNARVIRWSDGSLSLQIASSPNLYDLTSKPLAPSHKTPEKYDPSQDSHTYLLTPHESAGMLRFLGHATQSLNVIPTGASQANMEAVSRLHEQLAAAQAARGGRSRGQASIEITDMRDPEAERKEAERIAREKERAAKKLENQQRRARGGAPGGNSEPRGPKYTPRSTGTRSKRDSPPITGGLRKSKEDEYDLEDDFVQRSDDEDALESSEEDDSGNDRKRRKAPVQKKRREEPEEEDEEDEAESTDDEKGGKGRSRGGGRAGKRRRVVDDDDEDDE